MKTLPYKMEYSVLEVLFGLIGPAIIVLSIFYPIPDLKIGTFWLRLPPGVANAILTVVGIYVTYLTVSTLFEKRAANSQGASIVLDDKKITFTTVQKFRGVLTSVNYDDIKKVTLIHIPETNTSVEEKIVEISMPSQKPKKHAFDAIHMANDADFDVLVDALKHRAVNAVFEGK